MIKPNAPSCERNQDAILAVLRTIIKPNDKHLFEIGSGTGQHAVYMAPYFPKIQWQTSDFSEKHEGINQWIHESQCQTIMPPIIYQSGLTKFPGIYIDIIYTANTLHIMSWEHVKSMIQQFGEHLKKGAQVVIYGPFNYDNQFTSESNAQFDLWLKDHDPQQGIRSFEKLIQLMHDSGMILKQDINMPANNRILHFKKT